MAHGRLIIEAFTGAAIGELTERLLTPSSSLRQWLDEVSQPPRDVELAGEKTYTGFFYVLRNRIRRALVLEHRDENGGRRHEHRRPEHFRPSSIGTPRHPYDDDEFPGFG